MERVTEGMRSRCTEALSSARQVAGSSRSDGLNSAQDMEAHRLASDKFTTAVILLVGAPPPNPNTNDLVEFGNYIHELAEWTTDAKVALLDFWGINDHIYESSLIYRAAFDYCLDKWYTLKYEDRSDETAKEETT